MLSLLIFMCRYSRCLLSLLEKFAELLLLNADFPGRYLLSDNKKGIRLTHRISPLDFSFTTEAGSLLPIGTQVSYHFESLSPRHLVYSPRFSTLLKLLPTRAYPIGRDPPSPPSPLWCCLTSWSFRSFFCFLRSKEFRFSPFSCCLRLSSHRASV